MCLIIDRPGGVPIPDDILFAGLEENPDGWGIMLRERKQITCFHGMDPDDFLETYDYCGEEAHLSIHFRWATHGTKGVHNCHPFEILGGKYAVMHNGIIPIKQRWEHMSDTWHFCNDVLTPLLHRHPRAFGKAVLRDHIEKLVGSRNKLVILREDGARMFTNQQAGTEYEGLWLSNAAPLWRKWESTFDWEDETTDPALEDPFFFDPDPRYQVFEKQWRRA